MIGNDNEFKITFKNVGQGDSIIIEWHEHGQEKIGIIDANLYKGNPVLDHLIYKNYKCIDFIIISHPHFDHFSGIPQILEYVKDKGIQLKKILHTSQLSPDFLRACSKSVISKRALAKIFKFITQYDLQLGFKHGFIEVGAADQFWVFENWRLDFMAPIARDYVSFASSNTYNITEEENGENPNANILSTIYLAPYSYIYFIYV